MKKAFLIILLASLVPLTALGASSVMVRGVKVDGTFIDPSPYSKYYVDSNLLIASYSLDEGTGTVAFDSSVVGNNGTWQGTAAGTSGYYSKGMVGAFSGTFNGTNNSLILYNGSVSSLNSSLKNLGNLTDGSSFSAWIKTTGGTGAAPFAWTQNELVIEGRSYATDPPYGWSFGVTSNKVAFTDSTHAARNSVSSLTSVNDGAWHFIAVTIAPGNASASIYVDGAMDNTATWTGQDFSLGKDSANSAEIGIGVRGTDGGAQNQNWWSGQIDDLRIYGRSLSSAEIAALYSYENVNYQ